MASQAGPMMPPPEILAAAAALGPGAYSDSDEEPEDFNMIGPPPPEIVVEDNLSTEESRLNEVKRIIQVGAASFQEGGHDGSHTGAKTISIIKGTHEYT